MEKPNLRMTIFESTEPLEVIINGINFHKGRHDKFKFYGEENRFPFMDGIYDSALNCWTYRSVFINNEFYIPNIALLFNNTMSNKQTAVEWFAEQIKFTNKEVYAELQEVIEEAKEMVEEQISNGYFQGLIDGMNNSPRDYYNENYGN